MILLKKSIHNRTDIISVLFFNSIYTFVSKCIILLYNVANKHKGGCCYED